MPDQLRDQCMISHMTSTWLLRDHCAISFTNATLQTVETAEGVSRTVVDFGRRNNSKSTTKYGDAAGMKISGVADNTVRELHDVWADAHAEVEPGTFRRTDMATAQNEYNYYRGGTKLIA